MSATPKDVKQTLPCSQPMSISNGSSPTKGWQELSSSGTSTRSYSIGSSLSKSIGTSTHNGLSPAQKQQEQDYYRQYPSLDALSKALQQAIDDNFFLEQLTELAASTIEAGQAVVSKIIAFKSRLDNLLYFEEDTPSKQLRHIVEGHESIFAELRLLANLSREGLLPLGRIDLFLRFLSDTIQAYDTLKLAEKEAQEALKKQALQAPLALKEQKESEWRQAAMEDQKAHEASGGLETQEVPQSSKVQELWEELQALDTQLGIEKERLEADFSTRQVKSKAESFLQLRLAKLLPRLRQLDALLTRAESHLFAERLTSFLLDEQVTTLDLSHCQLTDTDLQALAYIVLCKPLSRLELADNPALTPKGINAFIKKLAQAANPCLTYFNIAGIAFTSQEQRILASKLRASLRYTPVFMLDVSTDLREPITGALNSPRSLPLLTRAAARSQSRELSPLVAGSPSPLRESILLEGETVFTVVDDYARMQICKQEMLPFVTLVNHLKQALTEAPILCRSTEHAPITIPVMAFTESAQRTYDIHSLQALCDVLDGYCQNPSEESIDAILSLLRQMASTKVVRLDDEDIYIQLFYRYVHVTFNCYDALVRANPAIDTRSSPAILSTLHDTLSPSISHGTASSSTGPNLTFFSAPLPYVASDLTSRALVSDAANVFLQTRLAELIPTLRQFMSITTKLATLDKSSQLNPWLAFMTRRPLTLLKPLTLLNLNFCDLDDDDIKAISYAMLGSDLQVLDLSNNPRVTGAAVSALCLALKHDPEPKLQQLLLPEIALTEEQLTPLVEALFRETCQVHTVFMSRNNLGVLDNILKRLGLADTTVSHQVFCNSSMLLLDFPAKRREAQRKGMVLGPQGSELTVSTPRRVDAPSSPSSSTSLPAEPPESPLLRSARALYNGIKSLIQGSFFEVGIFGGEPVNINQEEYTAPTTIAGIHDKLERLINGEIPITDRMIKQRLVDIHLLIDTRRRGWRPDPMSILCYSMLSDMISLKDAMSQVVQVEINGYVRRLTVDDDAFLCSRLENLISTLQTIKTLIQRLTTTDGLAAYQLEEAIKGEAVPVLDLTRAKLSRRELHAMFYLLPSVSIKTLKLSSVEPITDIAMLTKTLSCIRGIKTLYIGPTQLSEESKTALYDAVVNGAGAVTEITVADPDTSFSSRLMLAALRRNASRDPERLSRTPSLRNVGLHAHRGGPSSSSSMPNLARRSTSSRTPDM